MTRSGKKDKYEVIQEILDRPFNDVLDLDEKMSFFNEALDQQRLKVKELIDDNKLKFGHDFRIASVEEIIEVEHGDNQFSKIGRICGFYNDCKTYVLFDGELDHENVLDGYGRYITDQNHLCGHFKHHQMHGRNKDTQKDGVIKEGEFKNHKMHGLGKIVTRDGTVQQGMF